MSGRITTVAMSRSGQLGLRCTVELKCSDLSARLADASLTCDRALVTCEPNCVPRQLGLSLFLRSTARWGAVGYVAALELSSRESEAGATWQRQSPPRQGGEVRS
jgi:hypothetical protein